jgi:hypothetical protein
MISHDMNRDMEKNVRVVSILKSYAEGLVNIYSVDVWSVPLPLRSLVPQVKETWTFEAAFCNFTTC